MSNTITARGLISRFKALVLMVGVLGFGLTLENTVNIIEPYVRRDNWFMMAGDGDLVLEGHDNIRGFGGQTVFDDNGTIRIVYYDADAFGATKFQVETLTFGKDGWLGLN